MLSPSNHAGVRRKCWCSGRYGKGLGLVPASKTEEARQSLLALICKARTLCQKQQRKSVDGDLGKDKVQHRLNSNNLDI